MATYTRLTFRDSARNKILAGATALAEATLTEIEEKEPPRGGAAPEFE